MYMSFKHKQCFTFFFSLASEQLLYVRYSASFQSSDLYTEPKPCLINEMPKHGTTGREGHSTPLYTLKIKHYWLQNSLYNRALGIHYLVSYMC